MHVEFSTLYKAVLIRKRTNISTGSGIHVCTVMVVFTAQQFKGSVRSAAKIERAPTVTSYGPGCVYLLVCQSDLKMGKVALELSLGAFISLSDLDIRKPMLCMYTPSGALANLMHGKRAQ